MSYLVFQWGLLVSVLGYACYTDLRFRKVYNTIIVFGLICGLGVGLIHAGWFGGLRWVQGLGLALVCFVPLYLVKGMAAGDVKLAMVVGGVVGPTAWIPIAISIYVCGGVMAVVYVLWQRQGAQLMGNLNQMLFLKLYHTTVPLALEETDHGIRSVGKMPYALAIAAGTMIGVVLQH